MPKGCSNLRESLYEDEAFDQRQLAALVVSKVFYFLGELNDSLSYALGAGSLFNVSEDSDYVLALLFKAIDEYAAFRNKVVESNEGTLQMDPRLEEIVKSDNVSGMLSYCINVFQIFVHIRKYRFEVLHLLVKIFPRLTI